jgi:hypothetical protein
LAAKSSATCSAQTRPFEVRPSKYGEPGTPMRAKRLPGSLRLSPKNQALD